MMEDSLKKLMKSRLAVAVRFLGVTGAGITASAPGTALGGIAGAVEELEGLREMLVAVLGEYSFPLGQDTTKATKSSLKINPDKKQKKA